ncbi:MAG: hypothetical protein [Caudoviricetes sp.]|nr:MAG: hypothetical protein [Caudoviricetes sp.]
MINEINILASFDNLSGTFRITDTYVSFIPYEKAGEWEMSVDEIMNTTANDIVKSFNTELCTNLEYKDLSHVMPMVFSIIHSLLSHGMK